MRVIASDESRARRLTATKLHGTSPRGEQSSTEAVAEVQTDNRKGSRWVRNRNNEGQCDRFVKAEKSEEWMARSPVWPDDVIASETASRHQPMNWRDSIWVQDFVPEAVNAVLSYLWKRTVFLRPVKLSDTPSLSSDAVLHSYWSDLLINHTVWQHVNTPTKCSFHRLTTRYLFNKFYFLNHFTCVQLQFFSTCQYIGYLIM